MSHRYVGLAAAILVLAATAAAQYDEERSGYEPSRARYLYAGVLQRDFQPWSGNSAVDSLAISYTRLMPVIGFRQGGVDLLFGYTRYTVHGSAQSSILFATTVSMELPLTVRPAWSLSVPFAVGADYTQAGAPGAERDNFNVASVGLGAGLKFRVRSDQVEFDVGASEFAQYATEGFSVGTGFSAATLAGANLIIADVGPFDGIALGYRFRLQTWSMSDARFDYRSVSHGPTLGIVF